MQFIQSLFISLIPLCFTIYLNRKYEISDKDRTIVEKQFKIYNQLYLNIVKDPLNNSIKNNLAKENIKCFITEIKYSDTLYNYLTPKLYEYLLYCKQNEITDMTLGSLQLQIETDLETIKFRLGYPCKLKYKTHLIQYFSIFCSLIYILINIVLNLRNNTALHDSPIKSIISCIGFILFVLLAYLAWILINNFIFLKKYTKIFTIPNRRKKEK